MRYISTLFLLLTCFSLSAFSGADGSKYDYSFNQERMYVDCNQVFLISTFDNTDGLTVYNFYGQRLWEVRFKSKILSWSIQPDVIFIFSKARDGHKTILTCLDRSTGAFLWERP